MGRYSREFKTEAMKLVTEQGYSGRSGQEAEHSRHHL